MCRRPDTAARSNGRPGKKTNDNEQGNCIYADIMQRQPPEGSNNTGDNPDQQPEHVIYSELELQK